MDQSEEKLWAILQGARDAIIMVDNKGRICYWNPAAHNLFGYTSQEVTGKQLEIIIPERYHRDYREALRAFENKEQEQAVEGTFESEAIKRDGTEFPVEVSISTVRISGHWHAVGIIRDITGLRGAQKAVAETLARYQLMCDNQQDAIILADMETQRFLEVNKAAVEIYGYSKEEFLSMRFLDVFAEAERTTTRTPRDDQLKAKTNMSRHKKKDGTVFPVEMTGCAFMWKNRRTFCAIVRDISERQRMEEKR